MKIEIHKRTFEATKHSKFSEERARLNKDVLTSEYSTSEPWLRREEALMSDGTPNPAQKWHDRTFKTKKAAEEFPVIQKYLL